MVGGVGVGGAGGGVGRSHFSVARIKICALVMRCVLLGSGRTMVRKPGTLSITNVTFQIKKIAKIFCKRSKALVD